MKTKLYPLLFIAIISCRRGNVIHPDRKDIVETVYASGKITAENEYHVYALSNGTVKHKHLKEGDAVKAGDILYTISNDPATARLEAAKSAYENSRSKVGSGSAVLSEARLNLQNAEVKLKNDSLNYFRLKNLLEQNAASKSSVDNAFTAYSISLNQKKAAEQNVNALVEDLNVAMLNAKSQVAAAESDLDNYLIRSEVSGTVFQMIKEEGEAVRMGEIIALIGDAHKRIIRLAVDHQDAGKIKAGQEVLLRTDVSGNTIYRAAVSIIYPVMNEVDQTFRVDAVFTDSVALPFVHTSVEANIVISTKKNALVIPRAAFVSDDSVQVKEKGETKTVFVKAGIRTLDDVEIIQGLDESSEVVIPEHK